MSEKGRAPRDGLDAILESAPRVVTDDNYQRVVDSIQEYAIFTLDVDGIITSWNRGAERIKGWHHDEILGRPFASLFPEADQQAGKPEREMEHAREHGRYDGEGWRRRKDGTHFWAGVTLTALHDADGSLRGYVKVTRDLTARLRTEQLLRSRSRMQESVNRLGLHALHGRPFDQLIDRACRAVALACDADYAAVMEYLRTDDYFVLRAGYGWERGFVASTKRVKGGRDTVAGYVMESQEPVLIDNLQWETRFPPPSYLHDHHVLSGIATPIQNGAPPWGVLAVYSRKARAFTADEVHFVQAVANILQLAHDREVHERAMQEANEQLEARVVGRTRELERANQELEAFTYVVSHDLKEPVRALLAYLSTLEHDLTHEELARKHLLQAEKTAEQLGTLLQGLLEWSRLSMGQLQLEPVDVPDLLRRPECVVQWENRLEARAATLHVDDDVPSVMGAPAIVSQIFGNLVLNALKHNPRPNPGIEIRRGRTRADGLVEILVDDTGPGFPESVIERFERLRSGRPTTIRGGFGLALTARAVEKLGGEMRLERTESGSGRVRLAFRGS